MCVVCAATTLPKHPSFALYIVLQVVQHFTEEPWGKHLGGPTGTQVTTTTMFACTICPQTFHGASSLRTHQGSHTKDARNNGHKQCPQCCLEIPLALLAQHKSCCVAGRKRQRSEQRAVDADICRLGGHVESGVRWPSSTSAPPPAMPSECEEGHAVEGEDSRPTDDGDSDGEEDHATGQADEDMVALAALMDTFKLTGAAVEELVRYMQRFDSPGRAAGLKRTKAEIDKHVDKIRGFEEFGTCTKRTADITLSAEHMEALGIGGEAAITCEFRDMANVVQQVRLHPKP